MRISAHRSTFPPGFVLLLISGYSIVYRWPSIRDASGGAGPVRPAPTDHPNDQRRARWRPFLLAFVAVLLLLIGGAAKAQTDVPLLSEIKEFAPCAFVAVSLAAIGAGGVWFVQRGHIDDLRRFARRNRSPSEDES